MFDQRPTGGISMRAAMVGAAAIIAASFFVGTAVGSSHASTAAAIVGTGLGGQYAPPSHVDFSPVWKVWQTIDEQYVPGRVASSTATSTPNGTTDPQQRVWGMIEGMANSLDDPYTVFLPPTPNHIFQQDISGNFEGVGMEIAIRDQLLTVVSPLKNSPASKAGIKAGDVILTINGESTTGMSVETAVQKIRGPKDTPVTFKVARVGMDDPVEIKVTRDVINIPTLDTEARTDGIFVVRLYNFSATSAGLFRQALREFIQSGDSRLVLDLRGNPGGYLDAAVDMASWFLPSGDVIVTEDYADKQSDIVHRSSGYNVFTPNLHMIILVDKGSASASEILSGALHYYHIAELVGTNTFGKGSVQELVPITADTSLKITVARWLTPGGAQIPREGITPDYAVKISDDDAKVGKDPQLDKAVEILRAAK